MIFNNNLITFPRVFDNCIRYNNLTSHYGHIADKMKDKLVDVIKKHNFKRFYDIKINLWFNDFIIYKFENYLWKLLYIFYWIFIEINKFNNFPKVLKK